MSITTETFADLEAVCLSLAQGKPVDPLVARRIRDRAEKARQEILATHGPVEIAVDLVREVREE